MDTSHYQSGRLDLKAAKQAGLRWWYLKATEGDSFVDSTYASRVRAARRAGIPVGAYHFARPDRGDAAMEAEFFLANSDIRAGDMLPMLDLESLEGLTAAEVTRWTGTWVKTIRQELAQRDLIAKPIIYTPFNLEKGFGCLLWVARYSDDFRAPVIPTPVEASRDLAALEREVRAGQERARLRPRGRQRRSPRHPPLGAADQGGADTEAALPPLTARTTGSPTSAAGR